MALLAGLAMILMAPTARAAWAGGVYVFSVVTLFAISATYHRPTWGPRGYLLMKRLDHSAIGVLIAGTYTPICLLLLPPEIGATLLAVVWAGAGVIALRAIVWPRSPRVVSVGLYLLLGWALVPWWQLVREAMGPGQIAALAAGGAAYVAGAVIYAIKRPNPVPGIFGYHELFHALTIVASVFHFGLVSSVVSGVA